MVFESIVTDLLNRYIGDYVQNLDRKQLKIGIWGGDVVLNNLILKQSALNDLDLPVTTSYGHLGKLVLKIPWKNLYSSPVEAYVENLYLLVVPNTDIRYDAEKEAKQEINAKMQQIERFEQAKKVEDEKGKPKADKSFSEKLTTQIINNVQITINNIHIRYEDNTTAITPFAFGVTLSQLSVQTTDDNWIQSLVAASLKQIFKMTQLEGLSVYINCNTRMFQSEPTEKLNSLFQETIASKTLIPEYYNYILGPISLLAKLQLVPNPEADEIPFSIPKIKLKICMERLAMGITRLQYQNLIQLVDMFGRISRGAKYRKFRPFEITYRNNAREWWLFACECILETEVKRRKQNWSWEHIKLYRNNFRSYAEVYRMILLMKKTNTDMIKQCEELERVLDLTSILFLRQKTELEVKKIEKDNQQIQISHGWFGGWWSGSKKDDADTNDIRKKIEAALTNDEKGKLFDAIGYKENAVVTELPEFFVAYFIDFELHSLEVLVSSENTLGSTCENIKNIMKLKLTHVNCIIEQRPAASAIKIITNINKLTIAGMHQNDFLPIIVQSQLENTKPLLDIMFEKNPEDKNCDQRIHVSSLPLQIVYDAATVIELQKIFKTPETTTLSQWQDVAAMKLLDIKERSAIGLQYAIQNHPRLEVNMKLMPSYVLIPSDGKFQGKESILVFGLGKLLIKTEPRPLETLDVKELYKSGASSNEILTEMIKQSYDKFTLEIHSIQAIVASPAENWQNVILQDNITDMHILQPATLKLSAHICVIEDDPRLPKTKIVGEISKIHINVTENRILEAYSIINSLPIQENEDIKPKLLNKESNILSSSMSLLKYLDEKQKTISINNKSELVTDEMSETIQYTVLDIKLVMNELCITMNQQIYSSDSSNDLYKTPTEEFSSSTKQFITLDLPDFQNQQKIVRFKLQQLELNLIQQTYDMRINLMLGAVALDQFRYKNGKESVINVISNPKYERNSDLLFSLSYTDCQKTSPEFVTKHKSTEKLIEIQFSTLLLILHQEALTELIQLFNEFESRIKAIHRINEKPHDRIATIYGDSAAEQIFSAAKNKLPVIFEDEKIMVLKSNLKKIKKQNEVVDSIKIKFLAKMEDVTVNILTDYWELASLEVKNLAVTVLLKSSYTEINLQLQDIIVLDHNPLSIYTKILSIVGDKALNSSIVIFNINETSAYSSDNIRIDLTMGCAKIIFLNRFVSSVLNFFGHFQAAQRKIKDVSTAVAEAAKTNVVEAYTQSNLIRLLIKINAPIIVVPVSSNSLEAILIDLGHLNVANSFIDIKTNDEHPAILDDIQIELKDIKISKINFQTSVDKLNASSDNNDNNHILNPTTFSLYMQRNLSCYWFKDRPEIEISGRLNDIDLNITGDNYNIVMQILSKNLKEGQEQLITITNPANKNITVTRAEYYSQPNPTSETNIGIDPSATASQKKQTVDTFLKFSFQIDSVKVKLLTAPDTGLATIALYFFSIKGQKLVDGSLSTAIVLCDVHLDDTRPKRENKITRFLERREQNRCSNFNENTSSLFSRPMIDIMLNMKDLYIFVDVKVFSFNLILYLDFLLKVSKFFQTSAMSEDVRHQQKNQSVKKSSFAQHQLIQEQPQQNLTVMLHIEQPDIILVEKMDDMDCYALISNVIYLKGNLLLK